MNMFLNVYFITSNKRGTQKKNIFLNQNEMSVMSVPLHYSGYRNIIVIRVCKIKLLLNDYKFVSMPNIPRPVW